MQLKTTRFGDVSISADDILLFPHGLIGLDECRHWVLLSDFENPVVGWLQSVGREDIALAVVSPRRFVPDYQVRVYRRQIGMLELGELDQAYVLVVVSRSDDALTANLRAPLIINLDRKLGRQVVTNDEQPLRAPLLSQDQLIRKSA